MPHYEPQRGKGPPEAKSAHLTTYVYPWPQFGGVLGPVTCKTISVDQRRAVMARLACKQMLAGIVRRQESESLQTFPERTNCNWSISAQVGRRRTLGTRGGGEMGQEHRGRRDDDVEQQGDGGMGERRKNNHSCDWRRPHRWGERRRHNHSHN